MQKYSFQHDVLPLKDKLFRLAYRITLNQVEAEDIVQETLIKVWNKREEWNTIISIEAYCITLTRNLAIDKSQKSEAQNTELTEEATLHTNESTPQQELEYSERMELIHRLINTLPERQRTILQLRDMEEKSYKEIAEIMHLSEEQVKVNLFRARQKIKNRYTKIDNYGL